MPSYEYRHATWDEVCDLGPQGWRLVAVPPIQEVKQVLGQPQLGELLYAMERQAPAPIEFHMAGMSNLGSLVAASGDMLRQEDGQPAGESMPQRACGRGPGICPACGAVKAGDCFGLAARDAGGDTPE